MPRKSLPQPYPQEKCYILKLQQTIINPIDNLGGLNEEERMQMPYVTSKKSLLSRSNTKPIEQI